MQLSLLCFECHVHMLIDVSTTIFHLYYECTALFFFCFLGYKKA